MTIAAVSLLVTACKSASTVTTGPGAAKCELTLAGPSTVVAGGGTGTVSVTAQTECEWAAATDASWISELTPVSGQGNGSFSFRVAPNPAASGREGDIVVNDSRVRISQAPAPCQIDISPLTDSVPASGTSGTVTIASQSGCAWTATSGDSWITITSSARGSGNGTVSYSVAPNNSASGRSGTMTIGDRTFTVNQAGTSSASCTFTLNTTGQNMAAIGGAGAPITVTAATGCAWTAVSHVPWITVTSGAIGSGNGSITFTVAANTGAARSGTMTIAGQTFTVTQAAAAATPACTYAIEPASAAAPAAGTSGSITVTAGSGCDWTASSNATWITITDVATGRGNGTVRYSVAANTEAARSGTITIAGRTFTVTQAAPVAACTYSVSNATFSVPGIGGTYSVAVTTGSGCSWTAMKSSGWLDIVSGVSGTGSGTVVFVVSAFGGAERSGSLTIAGHTVTVNQSR